MKSRHLLRRLLLCLPFTLLAPLPGQAASTQSFHVAVNGNDANPGTKDKPFATLERARDAVRQFKGRKPGTSVEVLVRAGTYELTRTFRLAAEDSGTEGAPVVYRAYPKEKALLIGGKRITGFTPHRGQILKADVGAQGFTNYFRQLFLDGQRMQLARYPNHDPINPNGGFAYVDGVVPKDSEKYKDNPEHPPRQIRYKPGDARSWARPEQAEVIYFPWHNWLNENAELREHYKFAMQVRAYDMFDEILDIMQGPSGKEEDDKIRVQRDRLKIDTIKWAVGKMYPKVFGDKLETTIIGDTSRPVHVNLSGLPDEELTRIIKNS